MPELPEVETIRRQMDTVLKGRVISRVKVLRDKSFQGNPSNLSGWEIERVKRRAKVIEIYFKDRKEMVIVHLKMTGQLIFLDGDKRIAGGHPTEDWIKELPSKHTRVILEFKDGSKLYFNDMRVFGWMKLLPKERYEKIVRKIAPDVTDKEFTNEYFFNLLKKSGRAIKLVLVDQEKIGGMGNIYANDALYLAKIRPDRKANSLTTREAKRLHGACIKVIKKGIKYGGSSAADEKYVNIKGEKGRYQEHFLVYQKAGQKCKRCGSEIKKMKQGGRGTFYCPKCQV